VTQTIKQLQLDLPLPEGWTYILRASFTSPRGWTFYAKDYGKRAFRIPVKIETDDSKKSDSA
jgi:hypothetical protein